jgi:5'-methylthioadenosine phosphorylase
MTIAAEAILAREAGLAYAAVCTVDNLANGLAADPLTVEAYRAERDRFAPRLIADLERVLPLLAATGEHG